ncbi:hypothetical protein EY643_13650 [Halioglobus maricola]|uniref:Nuclear transport factor 2 family protein n=1 Tax=Halioglobus maricola TaxID=2601894 RepID=A0A5P9NM92_9GAMM|nr:hypothetical protein [Halioglobus maricola]QFU76615.1 hypothetical protein EY643_13650 [Halioglobus maricola]
MRRRLLLACLFLLGSLAGCSEPVGPETQIRANIMAMESALSERSPGDFLEHLAESFTGGKQGSGDVTRDDAKRMLGVYFLRYRNVDILVSQVDVEIDAYEDALATSSAMVALAGGRGLIPDSARLYQVTGRWQNFDGDWKLTRLSWE